MKTSRRARRMQSHHKRKKGAIAFNMVSLMDIFTILVFFLLVSSSDVEELQNNKSIRLPESTAERKPKETLVILVSSDDIVIKGRKVANVSDATNTSDPTIPLLKQELDYQASRWKPSEPGETFVGEVTIMGDRKIPYQLLKKIMVTCAKSNYTKLSLAVNQASSGNDSQ